MKKYVSKLALLLAAVVMTASLAACSSGVNGGVAKYGSEVISEQEAEFWLRYEEWFTEGYYWDMYAAFGYENMWEYPYAENKTYGDYIHDTAMSEILQTRVLMDHAAELGVELTEEQTEKINTVVDELTANELFMKHVSATPDEIREYMTKNAIANLVVKAVKDAATVEVTDEECSKYAIEYIMVNAPEESEEEGEEAEEEEKSDELQGQELADAILAEAEAGTDLHAIAEAHEGLYCSESSYLLTGETSTALTYTASLAMKVGEIRLIENGTSGWYLIHRVDDFNQEATDEARAQLIDSKKTDEFNAQYVQWAEKAASFTVDEKKWGKYTVTEKIYEVETEAAAETEAETEVEAETETEAQ